MADEIGFSITIPDNILDKITKIDTAISNLAKTADDTSLKVSRAFSAMANSDGISVFLNKLQEIKARISEIGERPIAMTNFVNTAKEGVGVVNSLTQSLGQLNDSQLSNLFNTGNDVEYQRQLANLRELLQVELQRNSELKKQKKELASSDRIYAERLKTETMASVASEKKRQAEIKRSIDEVNRLAKAYKQMPTKLTSKNVGKLIYESMGASTINQHLTAIKNLRNAIKDLDINDKRYDATLRRLNSEIKRHQLELNKAGVESEKLKQKHSRLLDTTSQLKRSFALMFSVSAIKGYVSQLISVRGEFEMQQRSLEVLLQNKGQANKLWNQTVQLAVKSPFTVKELITQTKQLAAYRIETHKLYETNKMLSDVSAGLGVDMNRLILAYGQVKAANFLRGTELRQFSEAGVNMLDELAKRFTLLEGKAVSVADVFERVSKRMVTFQDVEAVFKTITSEGGIFYRMQEKQSETLKGQIMNLKDSIELMLNTIGSETDGVLKSVVASVKYLVENWRILATAIESVVLAISTIGIYKFVDGWRSVAKMGSIAAVELDGLAGKGAKLNLVFKNMWKIISANPILALVSALAALGVAMYNYNKSVDEANKKYIENSRNLIQQKNNLEDIQIAIEANNNAINDSNTSQEDLNIARNENLRLMGKIKEIAPEIYTQIIHQKDGTIKLNDAIANQNKLLSKNILLQSQAKGGWFQQDLTTNATQALDQQIQYKSSFEDLEIAAIDAGAKLEEMKERGTFNEEEYKALKNYINALSEAEDVASFSPIHSNFYEQYGTSKTWSKAWKNIINPMGEAVREVYNSHESFMSSMNDLYENFDNQMLTWGSGIRMHLELDPEKGKENASAWVNAQLEQFQIYDEEIKKLAFSYITKGYGLKYDATPTTTTTTIEPTKEVGIPKRDDTYSRRIKLVQDMRKAYEDLNKTFGKTASLEKILESFSDEAKSLRVNIQNMDVSSIEGYIEALELIEDLVKKDTQAYKEWKEAIREAKLEIDTDKEALADERLSRQIDEMFSGYELSLELEKLNIPPDLAKQLFNVDVFSLEDLKEEINQQMGGLFNIVVEMQSIEDTTGGNTELLAANQRYQELKAMRDAYSKSDVEKATETAKKITEMETKEMQERLKKYAEFLQRGLDERIKIKLEESRTLAEIDETQGLTVDQKDDLKKKVKKETQEKLDKETWEEFTNSETYIDMFRNMDKLSTPVIESMLIRLQSLRGQLKDLSPSDLKQMVESIDKMQDELTKRENPFKGLIGDVKEYFKLLKQRKYLEEQFSIALENESSKETEVNSQKDRVANAQHYLETLQKTFGVNSSQTIAAQVLLDLEKEKLDVLLDELLALGKITEERYNELKGISESSNKLSSNISKVGKTFNDFGGFVTSIATTIENSFGAMSQSSKMAFDTISNIATSSGTIAEGISRAIKNPADIGAYFQALEGVVSLFGTLFSIGDKDKELQIQSYIDKVENLERAYKKLEKAIESAYTSESLRKTYDEANKNLQDRINATNKMIALEEQKKATDKDKLQEYTDQLNELLEEQAELLKEQVEKLGGSYDIHSTTREFVDAWIDSFNETGKGLQGLKNNFKDFFRNIILEQAVMGGASKIMQPLLDEINASLEDDFKIDSNEYDKIQNLSNEKMKELDEFMNNMFGENGIYNQWITDTETGDLSGLQKGIQGVTEQTAEIIESLLNSIRFFVAKNTDYLKIIADNTANENSKVNPILSELKAQTTLIMAIRDMFGSVIRSGHPTYGGSFIKVAL